MILVEGLFICEDLQNIILKRGTLSGQVHSVFKNACNIDCNGLFITILSKGKIMCPMSVIVHDKDQVNFNDENVAQGFRFEFRENEIYCRQSNLFIDMRNSKKWSPRAESMDSYCLENELLENIVVMEQGLKAHGNHYGMGSLINMLAIKLPELQLVQFKKIPFDKSYKFIVNRFINFINAVIKADISEIGFIAQGVIGFGCGLTPAMDDFISGLMTAYIYMGSYYKLKLNQIYEFNNKILSQGLYKTTKVSCEMLKHSSRGETNEAVKDLMAAILNFYNENCHESKISIFKGLKQVIGYGETSGTDTALGIYLGLKILTNLKYRRVWLDEYVRRY